MAKKTKKLSYHQRIINLLAADGAYHTFDEIMMAIGKHVDSGVADAEYQKRHPGWEEVKQPTRIAAGRKCLIFLSLNTAIHNRKLVQAGKGRAKDRQYRLTKAAMKARAKRQPKVEEKPTTHDASGDQI